MICVTPHKIADERQDEAIFQFLDEMHNCPALLDISSPAYKDTKNNQKKMGKVAQRLGFKGGRQSLFSPVGFVYKWKLILRNHSCSLENQS